MDYEHTLKIGTCPALIRERIISGQAAYLEMARLIRFYPGPKIVAKNIAWVYTHTMNFTITQEEQSALLSDARETIAATLEGRSPVYQGKRGLEKTAEAQTSALAQPCGAFVTLHIGKNLRGCIGRMTATEPLEKTVRSMSREAAFGDPRFPPLAKDELAQCCIEISALSPMELCADPRSVQIGVHGLYLIHRGRSGVLLPQVPVEQGWDLDTYLDYICVKAGLPPHSYHEPGARLYTFTAVVFGEQ